MKLGIYVMKDEKVGFLNPMTDTNDMTALRNFEYSMKHNDIMMCNSADFALYKLGSFDTSDGQIILETTPTLLTRGSDFRKDVDDE